MAAHADLVPQLPLDQYPSVASQIFSSNSTVQKEDFLSHQNAGTYMKY
jgi:hypothetical protein